MNLKQCKVYNDGLHYIAIKHTEGIKGERAKRPPEEPIYVPDEEEVEETQKSVLGAEYPADNQGLEENPSVDPPLTDVDLPVDITDEKEPTYRMSTRSEEFMKWYRESVGMGKQKQVDFLASKLYPYFDTEEQLHDFIDYKLYCRYRARAVKHQRCQRRASLYRFNYFVTFTYDSKKMDENEFQKRLLITLRNFSTRKGWKYMGSWERGGDTNRLHFHAIMYIPEDKMSGELETKRDYNVKLHKMEEHVSNTFFEDRFGRNQFEVIDGTALTVGKAITYILKYIEKDGGKVICSRGLKTFIETDIDGMDVITRLRPEDDTKYILYDDFMVYKDGKPLGIISDKVIEQAKTVN